MEEDFINSYLSRWEAEVNGNIGMTAEEKSRLLLSKQTMHGWKMTGDLHLEQFKTLLKLPKNGFNTFSDVLDMKLELC